MRIILTFEFEGRRAKYVPLSPFVCTIDHTYCIRHNLVGSRPKTDIPLEDARFDTARCVLTDLITRTILTGYVLTSYDSGCHLRTHTAG